ncbi:MAG TPA: M1 family aminopeptidase, partial [Bacteroidota bacterium]|nr:M1 family aminopeptidase [Bacteroidota bacterium]
MHIDSVSLDGVRDAFVQNPASFDVMLGRSYSAGQQLTIVVYYRGIPVPTGFGSFHFGAHGSTGWAWTLSEPYGAKDWWPCKDDPSDKADSADVIVVCDSSFRVGSEGILLSVGPLGNGRAQFHWHESHPIASYLISIAVTNYASFSNWFRYSPVDSMQILDYVLPEHLAIARSSLPKIVDMLAVYSNIYGLYPFINEKYGISEFGSGGAMEHQTMTSTTTFDEDVMSHELAHQWFGDMITPRTWADLWLNEGFAQYSSALFREKEYGMDSYWSYMRQEMSGAQTAVGAIGVPDTSSVRNLFDPYRIYYKGATVLHMLRHVLGDSLYFRAVQAYASDPRLRYATASIADFQKDCEIASGRSLAFFFDEWINGEGFPRYAYSWSTHAEGSGGMVKLFLQQIQGGSNPVYFTMPVDVEVSGAGWDTTVTVWNDSLQQQFVLAVRANPSSVRIDPEEWILRQVFSNADIPPADYSLEQNYPNPFNPKTTIVYHLPVRSTVSLKVYDVLGREVATLKNGDEFAGTYSIDWDASTSASGVYFLRLQAGTYVETRKMLVVK